MWKIPKDHLGLITSQHHFLHLVQDQKPSSVLVLNVNVLRADLTWLPKYVIPVTLHFILSLSRTNTLLECLLKWLEGKFKVKVHFYSNRLGHVDMVKFSKVLVLAVQYVMQLWYNRAKVIRSLWETYCAAGSCRNTWRTWAENSAGSRPTIYHV